MNGATPTMDQIHALLDKTPTETVEELLGLLHRVHACTDQMLDLLGQAIPEVEGKPQVSALARLMAAKLLVTRLEGAADE